MKPDFLGIGAPRSGTSWLYVNLGRHPQIWLAPVKELHYFDTLPLLRFADPYYRIELYRRLRKYAYAGLRDRAAFRSLPWRWDADYFLRPRSHNWYASLFRPAAGQIAGEITPTYMTLEAQVVELIRRINPELKVIFLMRDPVDRALSSALKDLARKRQRPVEHISDADFIDHFRHHDVRGRSDYARTLQIWEGAFGAQRVFKGFFEELENNPRAFLSRILEFLGVSAPGDLAPAPEVRINSTAGYKSGVPEGPRRYLAQACLPQLEILAQRFGEPVSGWLRRARKLAA